LEFLVNSEKMSPRGAEIWYHESQEDSQGK
jgi:hypothetical protein